MHTLVQTSPRWRIHSWNNGKNSRTSPEKPKIPESNYSGERVHRKTLNRSSARTIADQRDGEAQGRRLQIVYFLGIIIVSAKDCRDLPLSRVNAIERKVE
jgi:hypothetical protein